MKSAILFLRVSAPLRLILACSNSTPNPLYLPTMSYAGNLRKMRTELDSPVRYTLQLGENAIDMNALIGQEIEILYEGQINCIKCGRKTKKSFGQGFCYHHFMTAPEASPCILRPELCEGHLGKGRDLQWELDNHVQPHVVYLALASGLKVGVTREQQVPTRWIDQGAWQAIRFAETPNRYLAGCIEVAMKEFVGDKTHWQKMLKNVLATDRDIVAEKSRLSEMLPSEWHEYLTDNQEITTIDYPVQEFPIKVKSINLDKTPEVRGILKGIKGQYLIFDEGRVMNIRKHTGYWITLNN